MGRNYELDVDQDRKFLEFNDLVIGQDRPIIESQRPKELPVDLSSEIQIRGANVSLLNIDDGYGNSLIRIPRGPSRIVLPALVTPTADTSSL